MPTPLIVPLGPTPDITGTPVVVRPPPGDAFSEALRACWPTIASKSGTLAADDLRRAVGDASIRGDQAAAVATLWQEKLRLTLGRFHYGGSGHPKEDVVTLADVAAYERAIGSPKGARHKAAIRIRAAFEAAQKKIRDAANGTYALWQLDAQGRPFVNPFGIRQGRVGDCYFLAALIAIAHRDPSHILSAVHPTASGFRVRLYVGGKPKWIGVQRPTDGEFALLATTDGNGIWLQVLEKALGATMNADKIYTSPHPNAADAADDDPALEPFWTFTFDLAEGIGYVMGTTTDVDLFSLTDETTTAAKLAAAFRPERFHTGRALVVTAGINMVIGERPKAMKDLGFVGNHAYAIVAYDEARERVWIQNPHGVKGGSRGRLAWLPQLSVAELDDMFSDIAYEERRPRP